MRFVLAPTSKREWFCSLICYSLIIAPFGCQLQTPGDDNGLGGLLGGGPISTESGLFINQDLTSKLLMAAKNGDGNSFYVYGTRNSEGNLDEIESISVLTPANESSFVAFESGRPVHAEGPDGSYAHVTYTTVTPDRLAGVVELFDAASGTLTPFPFDIDLGQAVSEIAEQLAQVTGRQLDTSGIEAGAGAGGKSSTESVRVTIFSPFYTFFVLPLVTTIGLMTIVLGQLVIAIFASIVVGLQALVLTIFSPLFLIAELLGDVVFRVQLTPLVDIFDFIPPPPVIVLT